MAVMQSADQKSWGDVRNFAGRRGVVGDLAMWRILSAGEGIWPEYLDFVTRNGNWPNLSNIREKGERAMPSGVRLSDIDAFMGPDGPQTGNGALRRAEALRAAGRGGEAAETIAAAWRDLSLNAQEREEFQVYYGEIIAPFHTARADNLLWRGLTDEARAMKPLVSGGWAALIEARARLRRREKGVNGAIEAVPAALQADPGLAYERFVWRMRANNYVGAEEIIRAQSFSAAGLGQPDAWGDRRRRLVRRALREGRVVVAYNMANQNHMTGGSDYSDLEWLAGWIALRRMGEPDRAIAHFTRFLAAVETPISLGRGNYWLGRAWEAKGDSGEAQRWYRAGAAHQTSFYGQLAAEKAGVGPSPEIAAGPDGDWRRSSFAGQSVVEAARLLEFAGDRRRSHWFLTNFSRQLSSYEDLAGLADLAIEIGRPDIAIRISKIAAGKGHVLRGQYYPVTELAAFNAGVEPALTMAIGRQESELNIAAVSPAGARGLMQLMPATAERVAGWLDMPYSRARLTTDWRYNAQLGQTYLARRLDQFGGSVAMAAAAYNAGAGRVDQWIETYGDPRAQGVDVVDWIESIPFRETRNYVQRVLEGLQVYRSRIAGAPQPFRVMRDARGF